MIVSTFALLGIDSGFTAMSTGVRVPSEFAVHTLLDNFLVESPTDKDSCTKSVYKCILAELKTAIGRLVANSVVPTTKLA